MAETRTITLDGRPIAGGRLPLVCVPLVARTAAALREEAAAVAALGPDLVEWRVDFFEGMGRTGEVVALAEALRAAVSPAPLLFTWRSPMEGGQPTALDEPAAAALCEAVCAARVADLVDFELARPAPLLASVRRAARAAGVALVVSHHDFARTPPVEAMVATLRAAEAAGADVAKLAVMPAGPEDVLALLAATLRAREALGIPLVTMSMGAAGVVSRLVGWTFGSCLTFGAGQAASAPGQPPVEDLRAAAELLRRARGGG